MAEEKIRRLFLCRHAKSEANAKGLHCGGSNESPLNQEGARQANLLGLALKNYYKFRGKLIFSSPRGRAKETARLISKNLRTSSSIITIEGLREMELGYWDGKIPREIKNLFPQEYEEWLAGNLSADFRFNGGESIKEAGSRIGNCFDFIRRIWLPDENQNNNDLIIVAHGGVNTIILAKVMSAEMKTYGYRIIRQDNACVNIITFSEKNDWRPKTQITMINSTHHLDINL